MKWNIMVDSFCTTEILIFDSSDHRTIKRDVDLAYIIIVNELVRLSLTYRQPKMTYFT